MFASLLAFASIVATFGAVRADINPIEPSDLSVYNAGSNCHIAWDKDTSGQWKTMYIELMTGDNYDMVHLTTVATVDGTSTGTYDWVCPDVTPNSRIYFYQFTNPVNATNTYWTTRFAIAAKDGSTTAPTNATQPGTGENIPWGTGAYVDPTLTTPAPVLASGAASGAASSTDASGVPSVSGSGSVSATASAPSGMTTKSASSTASGTKAPSVSSASSAAPSGSAGATSGAARVHGWAVAAVGAAVGAVALAL